jgi:hypothetical protein
VRVVEDSEDSDDEDSSEDSMSISEIFSSHFSGEQDEEARKRRSAKISKSVSRSLSRMRSEGRVVSSSTSVDLLARVVTAMGLSEGQRSIPVQPVVVRVEYANEYRRCSERWNKP